MVQPLRQAKRAEQLVGAGPGSIGIAAAHQLRHHDILARSELGQQVVELIDEA